MNDVSNCPNRWRIAIFGTLLQVCLGTVYAWSFFQKPLVSTYGWSNSQVAWTFSTAICCLGLAAAWGGMNLSKSGPRKLAMAGGLIFGAGYLVAALALKIHSLSLLYIGYGVIGGAGLGLGYVTPVATVAKWFPDKKGFVTGMVVMGFGFGALVMSKVIAPVLMTAFDNNLVQVFFWIGIVMLVLTLPAGYNLTNPPEDFVPEGYTPPANESPGQGINGKTPTGRQCILSGKFFMMWMILTCNVSAGIMFIGFQSPMIQNLLRDTYAAKYPDPAALTAALAAAGATLIAISSIFNGVGRFFWGTLSDRVGRTQAFRLLVGSQIAIFIALIFIKSPWIFSALVCYVLLCYGGGFGAMPAFVLDVFGPVQMPVVYGVILTGWSAGGIIGPQLAAIIRDRFPANPGVYTYAGGAILLAVGFLFSLALSDKPFAFKAQDKTSGERISLP
ncbi:MFS transporter [Desulfobacter hydrogenophilus]|uniref:MFS transporter n=1 Tax=Desulfobacter hydrogenophilus TaxID=2291 RepID=A0A328FD23_9BACT|nr:OFA family MFS transporter [Desulfobacter hydrogenophilus]NDY71525.1 OFA family MFS transporter [Desulfobacter hydrogenophilus]QBH11909.1 MFS transporter [Desulfobacter hydrogenophilus]RAM02551.1 MFS transporter [Desulfobacter hydrogenophilus]